MGTTGGNELPRFEPTVGGGGAGSMERILVSVRLRPLNAREMELNEMSDWECINDNTIIFKNSTVPAAYTYDRVFGSECTTRQVYEEGAKEVALSVVSGINSSIFAYGQTSSGKTYTMRGVTEYSMADIYDYIQKHSERKFILKLSAIEIYNESVKDLLSTDGTPLRLLDDPEKGTIVDKLTVETIKGQSHLKELLSFCEAQRQIGETSLNEMSSRSHQILRLTIESSAQEFLSKDNISTLVATVNFVDLAGSERASQALTAGARLKEGCHINRSLLTLSTVIRKLSKGRNGHVPYRDSKLTRILQNSLGGNARTAIICTMSPARSHTEQSRNSLLFASCAKEVSTNAQVNVVMSDKALVKHLQRELARLENELKCPGLVSHSDKLREKETQIKKMEKEMKELMQQRDLAQSRLDDLLRVVGDDRASRQEDESNHGSSTCEDVVSLSETCDAAYQILEIDFTSTQTLQESNNRHEQHLQLSDKSEEHHASSPRQSFSSLRFVGKFPHQGEDEIAKTQSVDSDHCKDVCCIEENESLPSRSTEFDLLVNEDGDSLLPPSLDNKNNEDHEEIPKEVLLPVTIEDDSRDDCKPKTKGVLLAITLEEDRHEDCELKTKEVLLPVTLEDDRHEDCEQKTKEVLLPVTLEEDMPEYCEPKTKEVLLSVTLEDDRHEDCEPKTKGVLLPPICDYDDNHGHDDELTTKGNIDMKSALERQVLRGTETENLVKSYPDELSLQSLPIDLPSSRSLALTRNRSCRVTLVTKPASFCFPVLEQNNNIPSSGFLKDISGRPGGVQRRTLSAVSYGADVESLLGEGCQSSERSTHSNVLKEQNGKTSKEGIANHSGFRGELKEMAQVQFQKQLTDGQEMEWRVNEGCGAERNVKNVGGNSMKHPSELPTQWPFEFETKQWEIIELWHACHVSLVHRTCFFLLFKGDPEDSIYVEIEHRRLSFLKTSFSNGGRDKLALRDGLVLGGLNTNLSSSAKALRQERDMLRKQMLKKLSVKERESLFLKWGIALDSKQRRQQLSRHIWTETNMEHVKDSASLVARLIGLLDPGQALKEIFLLNFNPQLTNLRSLSRKHSFSSFL